MDALPTRSKAKLTQPPCCVTSRAPQASACMRISQMTVSMMRVATLATALHVILAAAPASLAAQQQVPPTVSQQGRPLGADTAAQSSAPAPTLRRRPVFTSRDFVMTAALATTAALLIPADGNIAREFQRPGPQPSSALRGTAD